MLDLGEDIALVAIAHIQQGKIIELDQEIAVSSARVSLENKIPMADSIIYYTSLKYDATIWTQDEHFKNLPGKIKYFSK